MANPAGVLSQAELKPGLLGAPCPGCGSERQRPLFRAEAEPPAPPGPWQFVHCLDCDSEYLNPRPADPRSLYRDGYHVHRLPGRLARAVLGLAARAEVLRLSRLVPRGGRVFEIGCGIGITLEALARAGYQASGIEPSPAAVRAARARRLDVAEGAFDGGRGIAGHYDLVVAAHVIEHVPSPASFLEDVRRILRPGGRALIKTPVSPSWDGTLLGGYSGSFDVPYHLWVPSRRALDALASAAGLEVKAARADSVPNDWVHALRKVARLELGLPLPFIRPWNPLVSLPLWPLSAIAAAAGGAGRLRLVLAKPEA